MVGLIVLRSKWLKHELIRHQRPGWLETRRHERLGAHLSSVSKCHAAACARVAEANRFHSGVLSCDTTSVQRRNGTHRSEGMLLRTPAHMGG